MRGIRYDSIVRGKVFLVFSASAYNWPVCYILLFLQGKQVHLIVLKIDSFVLVTILIQYKQRLSVCTRVR